MPDRPIFAAVGDDIDGELQAPGRELGAEVVSFQSTCEGAMYERIHAGALPAI